MKPLAFLGILVLFFSGHSSREDRGNIYTDDFHILVQSLKELDPMLYNVMGKDSFVVKANRVDERLQQTASNLQAMYIMQEFLYALGDSHAGLVNCYLPLGVDSILPFKVHIIDHRLYVRNYPADTSLNGTEILAIDHVPSRKIIDSLKIFYPNDGLREIVGYGLPSLFNSVYAAFCHRSGNYVISTPTGDYTLPALTRKDKEFAETVKYSWTDYTNKDSLYCKAVTNGYGYFRFQNFDKVEEGHNIEEEFSSLIDELNQKNIQNLVLDLRYNSGGDPYITGRLASHFVNEPFYVFERLILTDTKRTTYSSYMVRNFAYRFRHAGTKEIDGRRQKVNFEKGLKQFQPSPVHFGGKIYVITSSMTESSSTMMCKYLMDLPNVTFVGTETGGAINYFCAHKHCELTLPNTHLYTEFGMQLVELKKGSSDTEKPVGLIPDHTIQYSIEELMNGTDKEMDWIRNDISSAKK